LPASIQQAQQLDESGHIPYLVFWLNAGPALMFERSRACAAAVVKPKVGDVLPLVGDAVVRDRIKSFWAAGDILKACQSDRHRCV
jgi:hypothetical protein